MVDRLEMKTKDLSQEKIRMIGELFPDCITETKDGDKTVLSVDFDSLKQELSDHVIEGQKERYQFTWPDKSKSKRLANTPTTMTLRPCREDSVDFDNTKNLYIEGDNLEVLKILRETYLGKVKLIYIDPPYNTGNDLVYNDDFSLSVDDYSEVGGNVDELGNRLFLNASTNGRFHTDWLNMIYSRLILAKDFLSDDGLIFVSIDDNELCNLLKIMDELFGEVSHICTIPILSNPRGRQSSTFIAQTHEYGVIYCKNIHKCIVKGEELTIDQKNEYKYHDSRGDYRLIGLRLRGGRATAAESPTLHFPIYYNVAADSFSLERLTDSDYEIIPKFEDGTLGTWRWSKKKILDQKDDLLVKPVKDRYDVFQKDYLTDDKRMKLKSLWYEKEINYDNSARELTQLGMKDSFTYAKPTYLLKKILNSMSDDDSIVMDFFSGSGSFAQSVMELNLEKGTNRRFILVQLPEKINGSDNQTICEIGKKRIRRVGEKIKRKIDARGVDVGFRVFKCDYSNMRDLYYLPDQVSRQSLDDFVDNIKSNRTSEDLLVQVMLELGIELSAPMDQIDINGHVVFNVDNGYLVACFDDNIDDETITMISRSMSDSVYVVIRSGLYVDDKMLSNIEQIFKTHSPQTKIRIL